MIFWQLKLRGIKGTRVLKAMGSVPRHRFVEDSMRERAYDDSPLPIGHGQTISQPYIVAYMTEALNIQPEDRVLEIGTGSGYQTAILAELAKEVYSIEIIEALASSAAERLRVLGYTRVQIRTGDGYQGWPEAAPFDVIIVTAAPDTPPEALVGQLGKGGRLIVPVGTENQRLVLVTQTGGGVIEKQLLPVRFVRMVTENPA